MNPIHDMRIMSDGGPAFAWYNELEYLRRELMALKSGERERLLNERMTAMNIVSMEWMQEPWSGDIVIRVRHSMDKNKPFKVVGREPV